MLIGIQHGFWSFRYDSVKGYVKSGKEHAITDKSGGG